ncbi:MAG TPA: aminotransferase class V-fold PLP-dependent enzyme [Candidatus Saccharimonadales bacterium]|nr:aminotransferase class V-fold PLP-dependent enzyme [Candidatus Saccharimonadales bacterium]
MTVALELRGRRLINARGNSTKAGGSVLAPEVVAAMTEAAQFYVRIEDMQAAAGDVIRRMTGAEAGYVTSGASAGLTLAAAAALAGLDPAKMNRLPNTTGMANEIICIRQQRNDYDHALRLAGAQIVEIGFVDWTFPYELEAAITDRTCAVYYLGHQPVMSLPLKEVIRIAHAHDLPVIVDASVVLPPAENLRAIVAMGADLVAFSGGKHIQGPQASGILAGRRDLILSAALQHQDMDVYPETWPLRGLIADGTIVGPPHHGIGRGFKVGKEEIAGLIAALEAYGSRDFAAEAARWTRDLATIVEGVDGVPGISARRVDPARDAMPQYPIVQLTVDAAAAGLSANDLVNRLQDGDPIICTVEGQARRGIVGLLPIALMPGDAEEIVVAVRAIVGAPVAAT